MAVEDHGSEAAGASDPWSVGRDGLQLPPTLLSKWQCIVDTMAELMDVPAGLIMRLDGDAIRVCAASRSSGNPYHVGEAETWEGSGLYCEMAINTGERLLVPDALADANWRDNPDVPRGMVSYLGFPIRWPDDRPFGTICVLDNKHNAFHEQHERLIEQFRDVIEHHLALLSQDFDRRIVAARDRERHAAVLARSRRRLRQAEAELAHASRLSEIGLFAGALVHEINQPLAAVTTSAAACLRWLERDEPDVASACATLRNLADAGRRAADVVGGLRSLARNAPVAPTPVDLQHLALETVAMLRERLDRAHVVEQVRIEPGARYALGDRVQVQLVFHNLLRNAIEAMAAVPGRRRGLLVSSTADAGGRVAVRVDDSGVGLGPGVANRLLRAPSTTKADGMGMGLTICRSIVEAHGGTLSAAPNPTGPGARFTFTLPTADSPS